MKEALFFSENRSLQLHEEKLDELIQRVVALAETKLQRKRVRVEIRRMSPL